MAPDLGETRTARGAAPPEGAVLITEPDFRDNCAPRGENPIWILVADGSACSGSWSHRGSGEHEGVSGDWCVWCPADMYWRSGWGCCFER